MRKGQAVAGVLAAASVSTLLAVGLATGAQAVPENTAVRSAPAPAQCIETRIRAIDPRLARTNPHEYVLRVQSAIRSCLVPPRSTTTTPPTTTTTTGPRTTTTTPPDAAPADDHHHDDHHDRDDPDDHHGRRRLIDDVGSTIAPGYSTELPRAFSCSSAAATAP